LRCGEAGSKPRITAQGHELQQAVFVPDPGVLLGVRCCAKRRKLLGICAFESSSDGGRFTAPAKNEPIRQLALNRDYKLRGKIW